MGMRGRGMGGGMGGMGRGGGRGGMRGGAGPRQPREGLGPRAQQRLREAEALRDAGRYADAAAVYTEMAGIARSRGMRRVAGHLAIQAARCHARLGQGPAAAASARLAMQDAQEDDEGGSGLLARFGELLSDLKETALGSVATQLQGEVEQSLGAVPPVAMAAPAPMARKPLPPHCPTCGAPVGASKVSWEPDGSADCPYCGVVLTG